MITSPEDILILSAKLRKYWRYYSLWAFGNENHKKDMEIASSFLENLGQFMRFTENNVQYGEAMEGWWALLTPEMRFFINGILGVKKPCLNSEN